MKELTWIGGDDKFCPDVGRVVNNGDTVIAKEQIADRLVRSGLAEEVKTKVKSKKEEITDESGSTE